MKRKISAVYFLAAVICRYRLHLLRKIIFQNEISVVLWYNVFRALPAFCFIGHDKSPTNRSLFLFYAWGAGRVTFYCFPYKEPISQCFKSCGYTPKAKKIFHLVVETKAAPEVFLPQKPPFSIILFYLLLFLSYFIFFILLFLDVFLLIKEKEKGCICGWVGK